MEIFTSTETIMTRFCLFKYYKYLVHNNPKAELPKGVTRNRRRTGSLSVSSFYREKVCSTPTTRNSYGLLPQDYCDLTVILI